MRIIKTIALMLSVLSIGSCLQPISEENLLDYVPIADNIQSRAFTANNSDLLIVTVYGGTLQPALNPGHFALTRGADIIPLTTPIRADDSCVLFSFDTPLEPGNNYRLTIRPQAIQIGDFTRMVNVQAVSSGQFTGTENTGFENTRIRAADHRNGRFVTVGDEGKMAYSVDDGISWASVHSGEGLDGNKFVGAIYGIAAGNNVFYAVGEGARMSWSGSGVTWGAHEVRDQDNRFVRYGESMFDGRDILAVTYGRGSSSGRFVTAGDDGRSIFRWDQDVWRWAERITDPANKIISLTWGNTGRDGIFIASGIEESGSGTVLNSRLYYSEDGFDDGARTMKWIPINSPFGTSAIRCTAFGNDIFVIGTDGGHLAKSYDGIEWIPVDSPFGSSGIVSITFGAGVFAAAGHDGKIAVSDNGISWTLLEGHGFTSDERINALATNGRGRFIAAGNRDGDNRSRIISWYQKPAAQAIAQIPDMNAINWNTAAGMDGSEIRGLAWNGSIYVAVGEGKIASSADGSNWIENTANKSQWYSNAANYIFFRDIVWGSNQFIAVGYWVNRSSTIGAIAVSDANGENWMVYNVPILEQPIAGGTLHVDPRLYSIAYNGSTYVAVGERGYSAWSTPADPAVWNPVWAAPFSQPNQEETNQDINTVISDGQRFIAGGTRGKLAWSANGTSWTWIANGLLDSDYDDILTLTYGNGTYIAAGANGRMKTASRAQALTENGVGWTAVQSGFFTNINAVTWGSGRFLAVGDGGIVTMSYGGSIWTILSQTGWNSHEHIFSAVCGDRFITGGYAKIVYSE